MNQTSINQSINQQILTTVASWLQLQRNEKGEWTPVASRRNPHQACSICSHQRFCACLNPIALLMPVLGQNAVNMYTTCACSFWSSILLAGVAKLKESRHISSGSCTYCGLIVFFLSRKCRCGIVDTITATNAPHWGGESAPLHRC